MLTRFVKTPGQSLVQAAKGVLRFVKGSLSESIFHKREGERDWVGFSDSDRTGDVEKRKSTTGFLF